MAITLSPAYRSNPVVYPRLCYSTMLGMEDRADFSVGPRVADDWALATVTRGTLICEQDGRELRLGAGEFILLDLRIPCRCRFFPDTPSEIYWMRLGGEFTANLVGLIACVHPLPVTGCDPGILDSLRLALTLNDPGHEDAFSHSMNISNTLLHILESVYNRQREDCRLTEEVRFRAKFEEALSACDPATVSLTTLCERMHLNKYYFSHQFRRYYGMPPMKYVMNQRIERAKNLLRYSDGKIAAVAREVGFASPTYFSTVFRRETGLSPEAFRTSASGGGKTDNT